MPRKFKVYMHTTAYAILIVELSDDKLKEIAQDLDINVDDSFHAINALTYDDLRSYVEERVYDNPGVPSICAQCSGWGNKTQSLELGDDWEIDEDATGDSYKAVIEITGE